MDLADSRKANACGGFSITACARMETASELAAIKVGAKIARRWSEFQLSQRHRSAAVL